MENSENSFSNNIALLIDFENFIGSAKEINLPVDLEVVINKLLENGHISIRRGFGDLSMACRPNWNAYAQIRRMISENFIQFEDIPYITSNKNSADIRLVVEALSIAYTYPEIKIFAIVASDRDYVPLISKLRELGRRIIGIGCSPEIVNKIYVKSCDQFIYYSSLLPAGKVQSQSIALTQPNSMLLDDYIRLLCEVVALQEQNQKEALGTNLKELLQKRRSDFDLALVGLRKIGDLVDKAVKKGLCKRQSSGCDMLITLTPEGLKLIEPQDSLPQLDSSDVGYWFEQYKKFFEEKLKCEMPPIKLRNLVYKKAAKILEPNKDNAEGIGLQELSTKTWEATHKDGCLAIQPTIFKILFNLFRSKTFKVEWSEQPYNPLIKAALFSHGQWDELFIRNCLRVLKLDRPNWPLVKPALAQLLEIDETKMPIDDE